MGKCADLMFPGGLAFFAIRHWAHYTGVHHQPPNNPILIPARESDRLLRPCVADFSLQWLHNTIKARDRHWYNLLLTQLKRLAVAMCKLSAQRLALLCDEKTSKLIVVALFLLPHTPPRSALFCIEKSIHGGKFCYSCQLATHFGSLELPTNCLELAMIVAHIVKTSVYRALSLVTDLGFNIDAASTYLEHLTPTMLLPTCFKPVPVVVPPRVWHLLRKCILEFLRQKVLLSIHVKRISYRFSQ